MTYAVYNITPNTQFSIRGTTGTHPDSKFVFGIYISSATDVRLSGEESKMPEFTAYDDVDWSEAVKMAQWILEQDKWINGEKND